MNISVADVLIHTREPLAEPCRGEVEVGLRSIDGVISVHNPTDRPHLLMVGYRPDKADAGELLEQVRRAGVGASMIGL